MSRSKSQYPQVLSKLMRSQSTSAFSSVRNERDCYEPETSLLLVFASQPCEPGIRQKIVNLWKVLSFLVKKREKRLKRQRVHEEVSEAEEAEEPAFEDDDGLSTVATAPKKDDELRELFEKMIALNMDKHALAIADGYRTRPQVCICPDECCSCFDYSQFLHNLKLHEHKKLLGKVYARNLKRRDSDLEPQITENPENFGKSGKCDGPQRSPSPRRDNLNDEFAMENEESGEEDDYDAIKTAVMNRIRNEICSAVGQELQRDRVGKKEGKTEGKKGKTLAKIGPAVKPTRSRPRRVDPEPPYETKFNSVHRRVREFDPDSYKILVREEIKQLNEMPAPERKLRENRVRDVATRPPWKI